MAQWKRAGPITQRTEDRNYLLLFFSRISESKQIKSVTSQVNKREYGEIYTTWPEKNHNTRSRVLKTRNTSRMAQRKRAGPITQRSVDRNYLLLNFFKNFNWRGHQNSYLTSQQERIQRNLHYIASEEPQDKVDSFHKTLRPAGCCSGSVLGP